MFTGEKRFKYKFLKNVILRLDKHSWTEEDLRFIDNEFKKFIKRIKVEEIAALRSGEMFLGKYCEVDLSNIDDVRDLIYKCCDSIDQISSDVCIVIVGALTRLALSEIDGKYNVNEIKEEQ